MLSKVQQKLIQDFAELKEKRLIIPYYISIELPQKQRKIVQWWSQMIESAIRRSNQVYLSPSDLQIIFTLHGLKPVPLMTVLKILSSSPNFEWRDRNTVDQLNQDYKTKQSLIRMLVNAILPPKDKNLQLSQYRNLQNDTHSKFISKKFMLEVIDIAKNLIEVELAGDTNIEYDYVICKLKQQLPFSATSIQFLIDQLTNKSWITVQKIQGRKAIFYINNLSNSNNKKWMEVERSKFQLKTAINQFNKQIQLKSKQEAKKMLQAKKCVQTDKNRARKILQQVKSIKKSKQVLQTRIKALQDNLHQLQINMSNGETIDILATTQQLLKQTKIDPDAIESIIQKNQQIKLNQQEINMNIQQLNDINNDGDDIEEEVDNIMKELEKQVKVKKQAQAQKSDSSKKFVDDKNFQDALKPFGFFQNS